jgi:hypothetical protein
VSGSARRCLTRIREELVAGGFDVRLAEFGAGVDPLWVIDPKNQDDGSLATIALIGDPEAGAAELWIVDRVAHGRSAIRRIAVPPGDAGHGAEVVAIRALEFLRASALELAVDAQAAASPAPLDGSDRPDGLLAAAQSASAPARPLAIEAGISVLDSLGGPGPALVPVVRLGLQLPGPFAARLTLAGLGSRPHPTSALGTASVVQDFALLELSAVMRRGKRIRPKISVGAGALTVSVDGGGVWPYEGRAGRRWAALFDGSVGVSAVGQSQRGVVFELHALLAAPYPTVRFSGADVASVGHPALLASFTLVTPL